MYNLFPDSSLAQDQHERAICIILSGAGSDGALGVRAIKGEGGMIMVQNPESTEYDGMPRSAIATGLVDYELPPAEMPALIMAYIAHAFGMSPRHATAPVSNAENTIKKIFILLRNQIGHDFSQYKPSTIHRRIERRMAVHQIDTMDGYVKYLQQTPPEVEALFRDLLIGVTKFFRDPEAFKVLEEQAIPKLFEGKPESATIRVWSPGCSTGEEAYSLAILLAEHQEVIKKSYKVQVFATDIDSQAIATARSGIYPASIATDISQERLSRFFVINPEGGKYRIHKNIRDMLVFSEQNVIKDPPFSKLDLISCRNLLIYMGGDLQKKLFPLFHYALNPNGFLFLGTSDAVVNFDDMFAILDRKSKLYQRKEDFFGQRRAGPGRFIPPMTTMDAAHLRDAGKTTLPRKLPLRELTEQAILQQVAPVGALINEQGDILYLHGRTGLYLEPAIGETGSYNILKMAREGLQRVLTMALHKAARGRNIVRCPGLRVKTNGDFTTANLTIRPVVAGPDATPDTPLYLVIIEEAPPFDHEQAHRFAALQTITGADGSGPISDADTHIAALNLELRAKDEYLLISNEELETSNEELKSSNEEMQSVNEELQSTNEQMETSKEELQSVNEELSTVNSELQIKVTDLSRVNNDMNNLLAGTGIGTVFVDFHLRILRFTPAAGVIINLISSDVGRPVGHIVSNLVGYNNLVEDVQAVLDTLIHKEVDVRTIAGKWFTMRIQPYRTIDNVIEGAVISFVDITEIIQAAEALRASEERYRGLITHLDAGVVVYAADTSVIMSNPRASELLGLSERQIKSMMFIDHQWKFLSETGIPLQHEEYPVNRIVASKEPIKDQLLGVNRTATNDIVWLTVNGFPVLDKNGQISEIIISFIDITERKRAEEALRKANDLLRLAVVVRDSNDAVILQDLEGRIMAWNPAAVRIYGWSRAEALERNIRDLIPEWLKENESKRVQQLIRNDLLEPYRAERLTKAGTVVEVWLTATALLDEAGQVYAIATSERAGGSNLQNLTSPPAYS